MKMIRGISGHLTLVVGIAVFWLSGLLQAEEAAKIERVVAVPNACAWPNLQLLPNGDILAFVFNQPCHGAWEGDIDCWASSDGGRKWTKRGVAGPHEPGTNRMNIAVGVARNGDLVVLASGYAERPKPYVSGSPYATKPFPLPLANWICRSSDSGKTWTHTELPFPPEAPFMVPFGDMIRGSDGTLTAAFYGKTKEDIADTKKRRDDTRMLFGTSTDDGKTWSNIRPIKLNRVEGQDFEPVINEPAMLALDDKHWLVATRGSRGGDPKVGKSVQLYATDDGGANWTFGDTLSEPSQYPSHMMRMADGRLLLAYGSRTKKLRGVRYRISNDQGKTWSPAKTLVDHGQVVDIDSGYPASVQLKDGTIVTAYYVGTKGTPQWGYQMEVVRWRAVE